MEPFLIALTFLSLALAALMSVLAWKMLREKHDRRAARVEALEAMAFERHEGHEERHEAHEERREAHEEEIEDAELEPEPEPAPMPLRRARRPAGRDAVSWDLPLGQRDAEARALEREEAFAARFDEPLFEAPAPTGTGGRRRLALAAVALVVAAGFAGVYAWHTPEVVAAIEASRGSGRSSSAATPLELLSLRHTIDREGVFTITGLAQNPKDGPALRGVVAVVLLFDQQGQYFATGRVPLGDGGVAPGEEAPFVIAVPHATGVSRYRVGFRHADGGVVAHVDHRGQAPNDTTGDVTEPAATPAAAPRRSEG